MQARELRFTHGLKSHRPLQPLKLVKPTGERVCYFSTFRWSGLLCLSLLPDIASPDKNPGVKGIHERFARLGVIGAILRDARGRERLVDVVTVSYECSMDAQPDTIIFTKMACRDGEGQDIITRVGDRAWR